ncbi:DUF6766 family protein [Aestuariivirga sp.]|uniref:DUF6766 family protein n=1 Tax=Aestuariivirga sp. TaxID=2650926 RepID=UPI003918EA29
MPGKSVWSRYSYTWVTLALFLVALAGHWLFGWFEYVQDQQAHHQPIVVSAYFTQLMRGTLENWQSEFLQLVWQVAGLSFLYHVGSTQSRESEDRLEAKVDELMRLVNAREAERTIRELDQRYSRKP